MPIRFYCPHCQQRLSASSRQRGQTVKCPQCHAAARVPLEDSTRSDEETPRPASEPIDSFPDVASPPRAPDTDPEELETANTAPPRGPSTVSVPRSVLYTQGFLLGAIALIFFVFGLIVGSHSRSQSSTEQTSNPAVVSGVIHYETPEDSKRPDAGSVVMLLPASQQPDEKVAAQTLATEAPPPDADHPAVAMIRSLGGDYARADAQGRYKVRAASAGRYFLLAISRHTRRAADEYPAATDLAQLGRYVIPATELLSQQRYRLNEMMLREDRTLDLTFKTP